MWDKPTVELQNQGSNTWRWLRPRLKLRIAFANKRNQLDQSLEPTSVQEVSASELYRRVIVCEQYITMYSSVIWSRSNPTSIADGPSACMCPAILASSTSTGNACFSVASLVLTRVILYLCCNQLEGWLAVHLEQLHEGPGLPCSAALATVIFSTTWISIN